MKNSDSSAGGYIVLVALVAVLAMPLALGHFLMPKEAPTTQHADASVTN